MKQLPSLDLHGYQIADIADAVDRFLVQSSRKRQTRIRIVTGKGTGAVKKAVMDYLRKGHYPFEFERLPDGKRNEGVLIVILED